MLRRRFCSSLVLAAAGLMACSSAFAQAGEPAVADAELPLFAVELTIGPEWDASKPAQEQLHFREHSAHLKRLRDAGSLLVGARYSDKGWLVLAARDEQHARSMIEEDPSIQAKVFKYELHPFAVFYAGAVYKHPGP